MSIWDDLEKASVRSNRDRISYGRGVVEIKDVKVKRSENPKEKGVMRMIVETQIVSHDVDTPGTDKSFTLNMTSEFSQGECKALIAAATGEPLATMTGARMQKAVESGELIGRRIRVNRVSAESKSGNEYAKSFFEPAEPAPSIPEGWFEHPDRPGTYYNKAGELKTRAELL